MFFFIYVQPEFTDCKDNTKFARDKEKTDFFATKMYLFIILYVKININIAQISKYCIFAL